MKAFNTAALARTRVPYNKQQETCDRTGPLSSTHEAGLVGEAATDYNSGPDVYYCCPCSTSHERLEGQHKACVSLAGPSPSRPRTIVAPETSNSPLSSFLSSACPVYQIPAQRGAVALATSPSFLVLARNQSPLATTLGRWQPAALTQSVTE